MASRSWNKVELIGNLTRDPELRYTPNSAAVCTFSVATNRSYTVDGEKKEDVDFHRCVAWNKLAEICSQYLKKGTKVFVSGRLQNRSWEDATSGQQRQTTEIVLEDMIILSSKFGGGDEAESFSEDVKPEPKEAKSSTSKSKSTEEPTEDVEPKEASAEPESAPGETTDLEGDDLPF